MATIRVDIGLHRTFASPRPPDIGEDRHAFPPTLGSEAKARRAVDMAVPTGAAWHTQAICQDAAWHAPSAMSG